MSATTIGKLAHAAQVSVETVRFYERKGLIEQPAKPARGYRRYSMEAARRIRFIRQAQELGFSLRQIHELLALRAEPAADCAEVRACAREKLAEVESKIARLARIRAALEELIAVCPGQGALRACSILEALDGAEAGAPGHGHQRPRKET